MNRVSINSLRFCPEKYHPFDPKMVDKYVVGENYLPTWEVPSLKRYYKDMGFGMKQSFNAYLKSISQPFLFYLLSLCWLKTKTVVFRYANASNSSISHLNDSLFTQLNNRLNYCYLISND